MLTGFDYLQPRTLDQAVQAAQGRDCRFINGGTDVLIQIRAQEKAPELLISLRDIPELNRIEAVPEGLFIGAGVSLSHVAAHPLVREGFPALTQAISHIGSPQIRNTGTLGGNVVTASPAGDGLTALWAEDVLAEIAGPAGRYQKPLPELVIGPKRTTLQPGEIVIGFRLAARPWDFAAFFKKGRRNALAISIVNGVVKLRFARGVISGARIVVGAAAPTVLRMTQAEEALTGRAFTPEVRHKVENIIAARVAPVDDIRASAAYRRYIAGVSCGELAAQGWEARGDENHSS